MSEQSKNQVDDFLHNLNKLEPSPASTDQVLTSIRRQLSKTDRPHHRLRSWSQVIGLCGLAATILISAGLFYFVIGTEQVSAAEALAQVLEKNQEYQGWIHISIAHKENSNWPDTSSKDIPYSVLSYNTINGSNIRDNRRITRDPHPEPGDSKVQFRRYVCIQKPSDHHRVVYDSFSNSISIINLQPNIKGDAKYYKGIFPLTLEVFLNKIRVNNKDVKLTITKQTEESLDRFEVSWPLKLKSKEQTTERIKKRIIWVDRKTSHIVRIRYLDRNDILEHLFRYHDIRDPTIYTLGAPRDAKRFDFRVKPELQVVLDRLEKRIQKGLGDGVGVLTSTHVDQAGQPIRNKRSNVEMFANRGRAWLQLKYNITPSDKTSKRGYIAWPDNWPTPDIKQILQAASVTYPSEAFFCNGQTEWGTFGRYARSSLMPPWLGEHPDNKWRYIVGKDNYRANINNLACKNIAGKLWRCGSSLGQDSERNHLELLHDPRQPQLIGIRRTIYDGQMRIWARRTWWLDTSMDDLPIKLDTEGYFQENGEVIGRSRTVYRNDSILPSGQRYPSYWKETKERLRDYNDGTLLEKPRRTVTEYRLIFDPKIVLDEQWFSEPGKRITPVVASDGATGNASP